jgi:hypothetical protein
MDCVQSIRTLFEEPICPSTVVIARMGQWAEGAFTPGISETHFQRVHTILESGSWTSSTDEWTLGVKYTLPANHQDTNQSSVNLAYIKDSNSVFCYRNIESEPVRWVCDERDVIVELKTLRAVSAQPPEAGCRYDTVSISQFREFKRVSSAAVGITWLFRLTVTWKAECVRSAYMALPSYHIDVSMERDPSLPLYLPATNVNMQLSLAGSMHSKCLDMLIQPATLRLRSSYDDNDDDDDDDACSIYSA